MAEKKSKFVQSLLSSPFHQDRDEIIRKMFVYKLVRQRLRSNDRQENILLSREVKNEVHYRNSGREEAGEQPDGTRLKANDQSVSMVLHLKRRILCPYSVR